MSALKINEEILDSLANILVTAQDNPSLHLLLIENLVSTIAKICKMTLDNSQFTDLMRTQKTVERIQLQMVTSMLEDYMDIIKEGQ